MGYGFMNPSVDLPGRPPDHAGSPRGHASAIARDLGGQPYEAVAQHNLALSLCSGARPDPGPG